MKLYYIALGLAFLSDACFAGRPSSGTSGSSGKGTAASPSSAPNTQNDTAQPDTTAAPANPQNPQNTATSSGAASNSNNMIALSVGKAAATGAGLAFSAAAITGAVLSPNAREREEFFNEVKNSLLEDNQKLSADNDKMTTLANALVKEIHDSKNVFSQQFAQAIRDSGSSERPLRGLQTQLEQITEDLETEKVMTQTLKKERTDLEQILKFVEVADASFGGLKENLIEALETKVSKLGDQKSESKDDVVTSSRMETVSSSTRSQPPTNPQSEASNNVTKKVEEKSTSKDHLEDLLKQLRSSKSQTLQQLHEFSKLHVPGYQEGRGVRVAHALKIIEMAHQNHPHINAQHSQKN
jgi:hypothetical protein